MSKIIKKIILALSVLLILSVLFVLLGTIFVSAQEITYPEVPGAEAPTGTTTLPEYVKYLFNFSLILGGILAFGVMVLGGFLYLASVGDPTAISDAKSRMFSGVAGLVLLFGSYLILTALNPQLVILGLPKLEKPEEIDAPVYTPVETAATIYQEIPIGLLVENILAKNIDCYDYDGNGNMIDSDLITPVWIDKMENHDRLDCIKKLSEAIKIKRKNLGRLVVRLEEETKNCNCSNCALSGKCRFTKKSEEGGTFCCIDENLCKCENDPCPPETRNKINDLRNEIYQLINGTEKILVGLVLIDNPHYNPEFLFLKEAKSRLEGLKNELNADFNNLKEAENLTKHPYGQRITLAKYQDKKLTEKIDKNLFKGLDIAEYCRAFNCLSETDGVCDEYALNEVGKEYEGQICDVYNLDGEPATFYFPEEKY